MPRFGNGDKVEVVQGDAAAVIAGRTVGAVVMVNVLEHLDDDVKVLMQLRESLRPRRRRRAVRAALPSLYSDFDRRVGHVRRYKEHVGDDARKVRGFEVPRSPIAAPSIAWWAIARVLGRTPTSGPLVRTYDRRVVPALRRIEGGRAPSFGPGLVAIGRRPILIRATPARPAVAMLSTDAQAERRCQHPPDRPFGARGDQGGGPEPLDRCPGAEPMVLVIGVTASAC